MRLILACLAALAAAPAAACDTALVLAMDVSGSVSPEEYDLQRRGTAAALRDGRVAEALVQGRSAVAVVQWTGSGRQAVSLDWRRVGEHADVARLADDIATMPRRWELYSTAVGEALAFSLDLFAAVPDCRRRIVDLSSDGISNEGPAPRAFAARVAALGATVNALAITGVEPGLERYFREEVIAGPGAFVEVAVGYRDYPRAILRKLIRELTLPMFKHRRQP